MMTKERFLMLITESVRTTLRERIEAGAIALPLSSTRPPPPFANNAFDELVEMFSRNAASSTWLEFAQIFAEQREADIDALNAFGILSNGGVEGSNLEQKIRSFITLRRGLLDTLERLVAAIATGDHSNVIGAAEAVAAAYIQLPKVTT